MSTGMGRRGDGTVLHTGGSLEETLVAARRAALAAGLR